jgi:hypothetical protein
MQTSYVLTIRSSCTSQMGASPTSGMKREEPVTKSKKLLPSQPLLPRDPSLFVDDESAYEPNRFAAHVRAVLSLHQFPGGVDALIVDFARSVPHRWLETVSHGGASMAVAERLATHLRSVAAILSVTSGASQTSTCSRLTAVPLLPIAATAEYAISILGNIVHIDDAFGHYRIVSNQSIVHGPRRWRIKIDLRSGPSRYYGWIALGVTLTPVSTRYGRSLMEGLPITFVNEVLIATSGVVHAPVDVLERDRIVSSERSSYWGAKIDLQCERLQTIVAFEVDDLNQTMRVDSEGNVGEPVRTHVLDLRNRAGGTDSDFHPFVLMSGCVGAEIIPWPVENKPLHL